MLRGAAFLPRTMQIGLRSLGRRRRRSIATVVIVALAVGNLLAVLALAAAATESSRSSWANHLEDLRLWTTGRELFDARALRTIETTPGVARAQPALVSDADLSGSEAFLWGVPRAPLLRYRLSDGRWFSAAEERGRERVAVIERNLAQGAGVDVGDGVTLTTVAGPLRLRIIGLATNQQEDGAVLYLPLTTLRSALGQPTGVSTLLDQDHLLREGLIDRTTTLLDDRLTALGYDVATEISYVMERDEIEANSTITTTIGVLGFLIVAMSMVGLANAITMSILERTREIGILRCLGARARDVRRIFATEGITLALVGWLVGIPLGYVLSRLLIRLVWEVVGFGSRSCSRLRTSGSPSSGRSRSQCSCCSCPCVAPSVSGPATRCATRERVGATRAARRSRPGLQRLPHRTGGADLLEPHELLLRQIARERDRDVEPPWRRVMVVVDRDRDLAEVPLLGARVHDEHRRDAAGQRRREELVGRGRAVLAADRLGLVRDEVELPVDQDVLPQRAGDRARGGGEAHAASTGPACSAMTPSRNLPIAGAGWAPTKPVTGSPFAKTATVGMLWMP